MAIPELLFFRGRDRTLGLLRSAQMTTARKFAFMLYPLSGGYGYRCFLPLRGLPLLMKLENAITRAARFTDKSTNARRAGETKQLDRWRVYSTRARRISSAGEAASSR